MEFLPSDPLGYLRPLVAGFLVFGVVLLMVRVMGNRTLAQVSSIDFVATLAIASVSAAITLDQSVPLATGVIALVTLFVVQRLYALLRRSFDRGSRVMDNTALVLMRNGAFLDDNMNAVSITRNDVLARLRTCNVHHLSDVDAVVLERTGHLSVMYGGALSDAMLEGVREHPG